MCQLLTLPHAKYHLASWRGERGVITPSFVPDGGRLVLGNELLARVFSYVATRTSYGINQHRIGRVFALLKSSDMQTPLDWSCDPVLRSAAAVFVGYLMLDALVGNQDRHDENWGAIASGGKVYLSPTFDHASSLGRNENDEFRSRCINSKDGEKLIERYVARARSALFAGASDLKPMSTFDAFFEAAKMERDAAMHWLNCLRNVNLRNMESVLYSVQEIWMTEEARRFALCMLELNAKRLLDTRL